MFDFIAKKAPVITVDGPSGTGKGTLAQRLAVELDWHYLDSGALYRAVGWAANQQGLTQFDEASLAPFLSDLSVSTTVVAPGEIVVQCNGHDVTHAIRDEAVGMRASQISSNLLIRRHLFGLQQGCRHFPGLVTDGRDMGTVIFPDAKLKVFLIASLKTQAQRRFKQLQQRGINANLAQIEADLACRDRRDRERTASPTLPAEGAWVIDTSDLSAEQVFNTVLQRAQGLLN